MTKKTRALPPNVMMSTRALRLHPLGRWLSRKLAPVDQWLFSHLKRLSTTRPLTRRFALAGLLAWPLAMPPYGFIPITVR